jgi:hypothetical protein
VLPARRQGIAETQTWILRVAFLGIVRAGEALGDVKGVEALVGPHEHPSPPPQEGALTT